MILIKKTNQLIYNNFNNKKKNKSLIKMIKYIKNNILFIQFLLHLFFITYSYSNFL